MLTSSKLPIDADPGAASWQGGAEILDDDRGPDAPPLPNVIQCPGRLRVSAGDDQVTWMKVRPEVYEQMAGDGLTRDAMLAHTEGLAYLYRTERMDCRIARAVIRNILFGFDDPTPVVRELVRAGYWTEHDTYFELVDHWSTVRESLTAQNKKRGRDAGAQQRRRDRKSEPASVTDADTDDAATQPNNLTTEQPAVREGSHLRPLGKCRTCAHREPLLPDGRCSSCVEWDVQEEAS
jgi:hypothetical protein